MNHTYHAKPGEVERKWLVFDANDQVLGRFCSRIASVLRGKHKPEFTPHVDVGDFVIVINAEKVRLTGLKTQKKTYFRHTGYPGGAKFVAFEHLLATHPDRIISHAVKGMIPRTRLGRKQLKKLHVYAGPDHPHEAQQPITVTL
jgi:large subunit ribosomal protein L13